MVGGGGSTLLQRKRQRVNFRHGWLHHGNEQTKENNENNKQAETLFFVRNFSYGFIYYYHHYYYPYYYLNNDFIKTLLWLPCGLISQQISSRTAGGVTVCNLGRLVFQ